VTGVLLWLSIAVGAELPAAPDLEGVQWIARGPIEAIEAEIQVVEVWATWCGPCHETFPMLSELQKDRTDLRVVALTDDGADKVRRFFHKNGNDMRFAIAVASEEKVREFMFGGYEGRGLPSIYVIKGGKMLWSGEPKGLKSALESFGVESAR